MTLRSIRARYHNGVLEPLEPLELAEDQEVLLTLDEQSVLASEVDEFEQVAGAWADMFEDPEQYIRDLYQARIDGSRQFLPRDR